MSTQTSYAVGIDLGTTYSCVGVFRNQTVEIIASELGDRTTPSYVAFTDEGVLIGQSAKNQSADNPSNTVFDAKRLIGREFNDPIVQRDMKSWPFQVVEVKGKPMIQVTFQGKTILQSPQQISSLVLGKMKKIAEEYLGAPVTQAVITVPAYFNDTQRQATKDAGQLAGLQVLRIINEPTAAAIAYGLGQCPNIDDEHGVPPNKSNGDSYSSSSTSDSPSSASSSEGKEGKEASDSVSVTPAYVASALDQFEAQLALLSSMEADKAIAAAGPPTTPFPSTSTSISTSTSTSSSTSSSSTSSSSTSSTSGEKMILVFDLGGGTFDVSLLSIEGGYMEVKATAGDTHLGGEDFDSLLMEHFLRDFARKNKALPPVDASTPAGARAIRRLRTACEKAKRVLSTSAQATVEIEGFWEGEDLRTTITRARFESICKVDFDKCMEPVRAVLSDCKVPPSRIDEVVLVGGSTRIPKIREAIQAFFGRAPNTSLNPDEAVAYGAAVQAAIITGKSSKDTENLLLVDVAPLSLGLETAGHVMSTFIKRNSTVPIRVTRTFSTDTDNQTAVDISIYEGERPSTKDNHLLGKVSLEGIPPAPAGVPHINVTFAVDQDGILTVSAVEEQSGTKCSITITNESGAGRLSSEDIQRMIDDAEKMKMVDEIEIARVRARTGLQVVCQQVVGATKVLAPYLTQDELLKVLDWVENVEAWLQVNPDASRTAFDTRRKRLDARCDTILSKAYDQYVLTGGNGSSSTNSGSGASGVAAEGSKRKEPA